MSAAETHLSEMRDLADRIVGMGNTLATHDSERPETNVTVWDLGRELAELVQHFKPSNIYEQVIDCLHDRGLNVVGLESAMSENEFWNAHGYPMLDDIETTYDLQYE